MNFPMVIGLLFLFLMALTTISIGCAGVAKMFGVENHTSPWASLGIVIGLSMFYWMETSYLNWWPY